MDKKGKQVGSSSSSTSFTDDLFGPKNSSRSSSTGYFGSIFDPPTSMVPRRNPTTRPADYEHAYGYGKTKHETTTYSRGRSSKNENKKSNHHEHGKSVDDETYNPPIYNIDGQEVYMSQNISPLHDVKKDGRGADESKSGGASRGNWWKGTITLLLRTLLLTELYYSKKR
ncbi:hypothetical protein OROMI_014915 [Orobanche minor]